MRSFSLGLLAVSVVLAGCGSGTETAAAPKPEAKAPTKQELVGEEYRIEVPSDWVVLDMTKLDAAAIATKLKGTRYENALENVQGYAGGKSVRMYAFIPELESDYVNGNINLLISPSQADPAAVLEANEKQLMQFAKEPEVLKDFSTVPDSRAFAFSMPDMKVKSVVVVSVQKGKQFVLTLTSPETADQTRVRAIAREVFSTFEAK